MPTLLEMRPHLSAVPTPRPPKVVVIILLSHVQLFVEVGPDGGLPRVGLALHEHVGAELLHRVGHLGELHPAVALERGQGLAPAIGLVQAALARRKLRLEGADLRQLQLNLEM